LLGVQLRPPSRKTASMRQGRVVSRDDAAADGIAHFAADRDCAARSPAAPKARIHATGNHSTGVGDCPQNMVYGLAAIGRRRDP
jgi:hypothetical protein